MLALTAGPFMDARDGCCSRAISSGDLRGGRPLIGAPAPVGLELENGVSSRPTGDDLGGRPVGDVRNFAKSRPSCAARPVSSGTARLAFVITGELVGDSFGKRVAAADGEAAVKSNDEVLGVLLCIFSAAGFVGGPGPGPWPLGGRVVPMASYRWTISEIELLRVERRERGVSGGAWSARAAAASDEDAMPKSVGMVLDAETGAMNIEAGRERPVADSGEVGEVAEGRRRELD